MPGVDALALTCLVLLGAGYVLFGVLGRVPALAPVIAEAFPILHSETLIVGTVAGAVWLGGWWLTLALVALALRTAWEAAAVATRRAPVLPPLVFAAGVAGLGALASALPLWLVAGGAVAAVAVAIVARRGAESGRAVALDLLLFPALPLTVFLAAGIGHGFGPWLLIAFILVETFDSYALLGGKLCGRRKAFPRLSPNKTVEGLAIGGAMLMLTAALGGALLAGAPVLASAGLALVCGTLTVAGDLTASRLKRLSGVKDYPRVLPQQGGLLDIADAWIVTGAGLACLLALTGRL